MKTIPNLGIGIGLRDVHVEHILTHFPEVDWFEIISENFMQSERSLQTLEKILDRYTVVQHGVSLSIGSADPLDFTYLKNLKKLALKTKTPWISDHLSWGRLAGAHYHDLLPLPYTQNVIDYVADRARIVQDYLEIPFALENISSYAASKQNEMPEWEFYAAVIEKSGVHMMLDVNNIYVSSRNHGFDPKEYYQNIPLNRVIQMHLAGHTDLGTVVIDSHNCPVRNEVWDLYAEIYAKTDGISTLLEWDTDYVSFEETHKEALKAKEFQKSLATR